MISNYCKFVIHLFISYSISSHDTVSHFFAFRFAQFWKKIRKECIALQPFSHQEIAEYGVPKLY